ncbi:hypothetical protein BGY98DRAFT_1005762 [Russula aff. rugulosa BPL654]|nr:hypothetical protein BGY98DRAFT_1005762 [Russula aff. rugulosa BPL654]
MPLCYKSASELRTSCQLSISTQACIYTRAPSCVSPHPYLPIPLVFNSRTRAPVLPISSCL